MNTVSRFVLQVAAIASFFPAAFGAEEPPKADPIIGQWRWLDHQMVECKADHTFVATPTNRNGVWKLLPDPAAERKYEFVWDKGLFVDTISLARDGASLKGKNQEGKKIAATRVK